MFELTAATLPYKIHHSVTYQEALCWDMSAIVRESAWRRDCLANQAGMSELARDFCTRDIEVLEAARKELEARQARICARIR